MHRLEFDPERALITATVSGFLTPEAVDAYNADLTALLRRVGAPERRIHLLGCGRDMAVQSPEASAAFGTFTAELVKLCTGRIAIIAGSALNRMQASRVLVHERIRVFADEAEAIGWLMEPVGTSDTAKESERRFA